MKNAASTPSLEELLAHSGWVRALARSLVADSAMADDVEQQVWLTAMEKPPQHGRNLKSWLATVVRSVAGQGWRDEQKRRRGQQRLDAEALSASAGNADATGWSGRSVRSGAAQPPEQIAERMETFQALASLVSELEEPYGSAIYLRFFENLSVAEVARQQGVPTATAQTRLHRGVAKLRGRMKARFGIDWKQRCVIFLAPLPAASVPVTLIGLIAMTSKTKWMIAAALLLAIPLVNVLQSEADAVAEPAMESAVVEVQLPEPSSPPVSVAENSALEQRIESEGNSDKYAAQSTAANAHHLRVLHLNDLKPAAGAEVLYFDRGEDREKDRLFNRARSKEGLDLEALLDRFGTIYQADKNGDVWLPPRKGYARVAARLPGKFASTYLFDDLASNSYSEIELLLADRIDISMLVTGPDGRPVDGVPLAYQVQYAPGYGNNQDLVHTDENGRATLSNMQDRFGDANPDHVHQIVVDLPLRDALLHRFDLREPPREEIHFQLPPTTAVDVKVTTADGSPLRNGFPIMMHADYRYLSATENGPQGNFDLKGMQDATMAYTKDGVAHFPMVGLGVPLIVGTHFPGSGGFAVARGSSSMQSSVTAEIALIGHPVGTKFHTTLVNHDGEILSRATVDMKTTFLSKDGVRKKHSLRTSTGENGELSFFVDADEFTAALSYVSPDGGLMEWGALHYDGGAGAIQNDTAKSSEVQLDPVTMGKKLMVGGVIVNEDKEPIPGAKLQFNFPWLPSNDGEIGPAGEMIYMETFTDAQGEFSIYGTLHDPSGVTSWQDVQNDPSLMSLWIAPDKASDFRSFRQEEFVLGAKNQIFVLPARALLKGRLQLDEPTMAGSLRLTLEFTPEDGSQVITHYLNLEPGTGRFEINALQRGTGILRLTTKPQWEEVAVSMPFTVGMGGNTIPKDWDPLDLRGKLFPHVLHVKGPDGQHLNQLEIAYQHKTNIRSMETRSPFHYVSLQQISTLRVTAPSMQSSPLILVGESEEIQLQPATEFIIKLPADVKLSDPKRWSLFAKSQADNVESLEFWTPRVSGEYSAESHSFTLSIPTVGNWDLSLLYTGDNGLPDSAFGAIRVCVLNDGNLIHATTLDEQSSGSSITLPVNQEAVEQLQKE